MSSNAESAAVNPDQAKAISAVASEHRQFISFRVGAEDYAVDIMVVREIKGWMPTTVLPNQPDYVLGVMNLRGAIVPIFDLRARFGLGLTETTPMHVVMIVAVQDRVIGLLADAVSDILTVNASDIREVPDLDHSASEFLSGIIPVGEAMVVLLSLDKLFAASTTGTLSAVAA